MGILRPLHRAYSMINSSPWIDDTKARGDWLLHSPRALRPDRWTAWDSPLTKQAFKRELVEMIIRLFVPPSDKLYRWGFKEIRYKELAIADFLLELFPGTQFVLMLRDPVDSTASFVASKLDPDNSNEPLKMQINELSKELSKNQIIPFLEFSKELLHRHEERTHLVRYERLITEPGDTLAQIAEFLSLDSTFERRNIESIMSRNLVSQRLLKGPERMAQIREISEFHVQLAIPIYSRLIQDFERRD